MKKCFFSAVGLSALGIAAYAGTSLIERSPKRLPESVQGIDYASTLPDQMRRSTPAREAFEWEIPDDISTPEGNFTFDDIESWTGEGSKRAALVVQWNDAKESTALVFGYKWDGRATGIDMLRAVVKSNPQLYALVQYTNVSSPTDPDGGYTINGIGWDIDKDGDIRLIDTGDGNKEYTSEDGLFIHPRGYDPVTGGYQGSSDYDYDNWKSADTADFWGAGWFENYWSYWVKEDKASAFSYSNWGASARVLKDGSWDGWNYAVGMNSNHAWKNFEAAPYPYANIEDCLPFADANGLCYKITSLARDEVAVTYPVEIDGEMAAAYKDDVVIPSTVEHDGTVYIR